ncbi:MAG TPA: hypothetical protein VG870_06350 [Chitinophagaceae bacterium]|nr:hypothetical protein [Chitinophagaceae bacterium]
MQFEEFDKKIREAADQHHPAYNEKAWTKMQQLLDRHLPQEDRRRRRFPLLWLLLCAVLAGAGFLWLAQTRSTGSHAVTQTGRPGGLVTRSEPGRRSQDTDLSSIGGQDIMDTRKLARGSQVDATPHDPASRPLKDSGNSSPQAGKKAAGPSVSVSAGPGVSGRAPAHISRSGEGSSRRAAGTYYRDSEAGTPHSGQMPDYRHAPRRSAQNGMVSGYRADDSLSTYRTGRKTQPAGLLLPEQWAGADLLAGLWPDSLRSALDLSEDQALAFLAARNRTPLREVSPWGFSVSAGPDLSSAGGHYVGRLRLSYGAGFSYTKNRVTLRTGLYTSRKIYSASADAYHPPSGYWTNYADLKRVDADCNIYEIPVSLAYRLGQSSGHSWFVSAGLSSLLMQRETYHYLYKDPSGQLEYKGWTLYNKNRHFFSMLDLSAGYQRALSDRVSLVAEPYLALPLQGVGFGRVKLASAGVLFTLQVRPFQVRRSGTTQR